MIDHALQEIIHLCEQLMAQADGNLNDEHIDLIGEICSAAMAFPPQIIGMEKPDRAARHSARGRIASILGFAGLLLENPDGSLNPNQLEIVQQIYDLGQQVLEWVNAIDPVS